ncbi:MAG: hypothetical protein AAF589_02495 [Planctomycetota bacterium]
MSPSSEKSSEKPSSTLEGGEWQWGRGRSIGETPVPVPVPVPMESAKSHGTEDVVVACLSGRGDKVAMEIA